MMCVASAPAVNELYDPVVLVKKLEREIQHLKNELAMHDTLVTIFLWISNFVTIVCYFFMIYNIILLNICDLYRQIVVWYHMTLCLNKKDLKFDNKFESTWMDL